MPRNVMMFEVDEWDDLVTSTYGKLYRFQQQDGCKDRGIYYFKVPMLYIEDYEEKEIPEKVNGEVMGTSFKAWLERDPNVTMIIKDPENKGILKEGEYIINIDW